MSKKEKTMIQIMTKRIEIIDSYRNLLNSLTGIEQIKLLDTLYEQVDEMYKLCDTHGYFEDDESWNHEDMN